MVTFEQVKEGIAKYIDRELADKLQGFKKWAIVALSLPLLSSLEDNVLKHKKEAVLAGYMTEDGMVNIDLLADTFISVAKGKGRVTEHIPMIGDVTFSYSDIEILKKYIKE